MTNNEDISAAPVRVTIATTGTNLKEPDIEKGNSFDAETARTCAKFIVLDIASDDIRCSTVLPLIPREGSSRTKLPRPGKNSIRIFLVDEAAAEEKASYLKRNIRTQGKVTRALREESRHIYELNTKRDKVFDIWALESIWSPGTRGETKQFLVQDNIPFSSSSSTLGFAMDWSKCAAYLTEQLLRFGPQEHEAYCFLECMIAVQSKMLEEEAIQMTFKFPSLSSSHHSISFGGPKDYDDRSLKVQFQRILRSPSSATLVCPKSTSALVMAVMMDFFRATLESWRLFVTGLFVMSKCRSDEDLESRLRNGSQLRWLAKLPRNLKLAFWYTYDSMLPLVDRDQKAKFEAIRTEFDHKIEWLTSRMDDVVNDLDADLTSKSTRLEQAQTASVKRLTILAAIFLPLSLSSSLLSMSSRVAELGVLWYDYFGVSSSLVFLMVLVYVGIRNWDQYASKPYHLPWPIVSFFMEGVKFLYSLMPFLDEEGLGRLVSYCFGSAVVASFWVGIVREISLGLKVLGYATAGFAVCLIILLFLHCAIRSYTHWQMRRSDKQWESSHGSNPT
ncbi:hypothetical protein F5Y01DRAFT_110058 [Xylaria sp. FL0043]|nr:hypothetical protein F5Y01DRAFT_110058 [Xylaria sp. FL0043]